MSDLFVDNIKHQSSQGSGTITLGASGEKITTASGAEFSAVTGHNYPAFLSNGVSSTQNLTDGVATKVAMDTEVFDTDSCYDTSTYRFTPNVAGKYFCYGFLRFGRTNSNTTGGAQIMLYKNGSNGAQVELYANGTFNLMGSHISTIFEMNGTSDYLELYVYHDVTSGTPKIDTGSNKNHFGAYRIGA